MKRQWMAVVLFLLFTNRAFGQVTYSPVELAFPQIAVGSSAGQNYTTLIQVVNNNSITVTGHIALFGDSGTAFSVLFDGQGPQSTMDFSLNSGATRQIQLTFNGDITAAWMDITYTPSDPLTSVILQFRSGTTLLSEVGVDPAFDVMAGTDFSAETDGGINTGIAIVNPSSSTAYVLARLWDASTGSSVVASTIVTLPANGHTSKLVTELFSSVLNISQTRAKISIDSCSSSACSQAGGNGFLATAIRLNGAQFTTIPVADRPDAGDQVRILPQVVFGGPANGVNYKTVLFFTTNVATGVFGTADIFDNDGNPLAGSADGTAPAATFTFTVPGNRVSRIVLSGDQTLRSGWMRLTLSGPVHMIVSAVFQTFNGSALASEASVLESAPINLGLIYVKSQPGAANVGVAFANPQTTSNTITLDLFNKDGFQAGTKNITLQPNGHLAQQVTEIFPELAGVPDFDGALSIHSNTGFSALALRLSADKLATLPVAADGMYRPSITSVRISRTQRSPAQVSFDIDVADFDKDLATSDVTTVSAVAFVDFGQAGYDFGPVTIDGTAVLNRLNGTISGSFLLPHVTVTVPSNTQAVFYVYLYDSLGNASNIVSIPFKF